jgi:hypothetical protein
MRNKKPLKLPLWFIFGILMAGAFLAGYYLKPTPKIPPQELSVRTMTIASANKAVVATISSTSVFISDVKTEGGITTITMSNGDMFWIEGKDLSISPETTEIKCSDPIIATPDLKVMTCRGVGFDLNFAWNKQP